MCTVSVIPIENAARDQGIRIVCNRDEQRSRASSTPPLEQSFGQRRAVMPYDPASGGTWIAANDAGLAMVLMNVNAAPTERGSASISPKNCRSRGLIIPSLLHLDCADAMVQRCLHIRAADFAPFRLILASTGGCIELVSDGRAVRCRSAVLPGRVAMFTSSGLGDHVVEPPRRILFESLLGEGQHSAPRQDDFHLHEWLDRPHLSVRMSRPDARTVSRTTIEIGAEQTIMRYAALDDSGTECDATGCVLAGSAMKRDSILAGAAPCAPSA